MIIFVNPWEKCDNWKYMHTHTKKQATKTKTNKKQSNAHIWGFYFCRRICHIDLLISTGTETTLSTQGTYPV